MSAEIPDNCSACRFAGETYDGRGFACRRHSPIAVEAPKLSQTGVVTHWPMVRRDDWCGDFEREIDANAMPTHSERIDHIIKQPKTKQAAKEEGPRGAFDEFWQLWPVHPRKVARQQCQQKWAKKGLDAVSEAVMTGLRACVASEAWSKAGGEFVPAPLVWLNQARWEAPTEAQAVEAVNAEHWHESRQGIEGKGADLGLGRWDEAKFSTGQGEQWPAYRARVFRAAGYHTLRSANG